MNENTHPAAPDLDRMVREVEAWELYGDGGDGLSLTEAARAWTENEGKLSGLAPGAVEQAVRDSRRRAAQALQRRVSTDVPSGSEAFALEGAAAPETSWLVPGLIARRYVVAGSGDSGAAKSKWRTAMMVAGLRGEQFLGRPVRAERFMVLDGENPPGAVREDWRALGFRESDWPQVHYTGRERLGRLRRDVSAWSDYVRREAETFQPDVILVDTIARATPVALLDNDAVNELYADVLVPLVDELDAGLMFFAHESQEGAARKTGSRASAMLGARAWFDQADGLVTFRKTSGAGVQTMPIAAGGAGTRTTFAMRVEKMRGHEPEGKPEAYAVTGHRTDAGVLESLAVVPGSGDEEDIDRIVAAAPGTTGELAAAVAMNRTGDRFRRLLGEAESRRRLVKDDGGAWQRG